MIGVFDKDRYKKLTKHLTQKEISEKLTYEYGIETKIDSIKSWTRKEDRNNPSLDRLNALSRICNCSIQDFFTDAEEKREKIAFEELSKQPEKYSKSVLSSLSSKTQEIINNIALLTEAQQKEALEYIKDIAHQGKPKL